MNSIRYYAKHMVLCSISNIEKAYGIVLLFKCLRGIWYYAVYQIFIAYGIMQLRNL
jgi:hypothetical protein